MSKLYHCRGYLFCMYRLLDISPAEIANKIK